MIIKLKIISDFTIKCNKVSGQTIRKQLAKMNDGPYFFLSRVIDASAYVIIGRDRTLSQRESQWHLLFFVPASYQITINGIYRSVIDFYRPPLIF